MFDVISAQTILHVDRFRSSLGSESKKIILKLLDEEISYAKDFRRNINSSGMKFHNIMSEICNVVCKCAMCVRLFTCLRVTCFCTNPSFGCQKLINVMLFYVISEHQLQWQQRCYILKPKPNVQTHL